MRIPSGVTDQFLYFVAVDVTDLKTRETGLTGFTVYRSRNGAAAAAYTTPTVNETDVTNMPGVYELLADEDMTIAAGNDSEEYCLHITHASMAPVTRVFELYREKITAGSTLGITGSAVDTVTTITTTVAANVTQLGGVVQSLTDLKDFADAGYDPATNQVEGVKLVDTTTTNTDMLTAAAVNAEVDTALADVNLDHLVGTAAPAIPPVGTYLDLLADDGTATYDRTTDSLQAIRDRGDAAWTTGAAGTGLTPLASGTAQGGTAGTIQLAAGETFANDELNGNVVKITAGTGAGQARVIIDYVGATDTATVTPTWITTPDATSVYEVVPGSGNIVAVSNVAEDIATAAALATVDTVVDGIQTDLDNGTDGLGAIKADTTAILVDTSTTLQAELDAIQAAVITNAAGVDIAADIIAVKAETALIVADTNELQTDDVPGLIAALNDPTAAAIADTVLDEASASHVVAGSVGERIERLDLLASGGAGGLTNARAVNLDNLDAAVTSRSTHSAADVWAAVTRTLTANTNFNDPTAATIAAAVRTIAIESQGTYDLQEALSIILSVVAGVTSDSGATISTPNGVATRVAATINASQERTAMALTPSS